MFGIIRLFADIERIMPLNIKGILLYCFFVSEIERLLKNKSAQHGIKFLGRSAKCGVEMLADLIDRN